jgi:pimeloyl-ACP methyl ester carboxylesterase
MSRPIFGPARAVLCDRPRHEGRAVHPPGELKPIRFHSARTLLRLAVLWAIVLLLTGCVSRPPAASVPAPIDRPEAEPGIEWAQVPPELGEGLRDSLRFGYLEVPADHGEPDGARIRLAVAILPARTAKPAPDPVVFITGGPGANGIELFAQRFAAEWDRLRERRDLVILDPRGHGYSDPRLPRGPLNSDYRLCDEVGRAGGFAPESVQVSSTAECRRLPLSKGVRPETLSSVQVAQDLELLRRALGAAQLNLIGLSYGARIAAEAVRQVPTAIRAVWYAAPSVPPAPQQGVDREREADEEVVGNVIRRCAADVECRKAYPRLHSEYDTVVARLRRSPASVAGPAGTVVIDDVLLLRMLSELLRNRHRAARVPLHIHTLAEQGESALTRIGLEVLRSADTLTVAAGTHLAFRCNDGSVNRTSSPQRQQRCRAWVGAAYDGSYAEPLRSDIPGLITVGEFDAITPAADARLLAAGLPRAHWLILPWEGHLWTAACAPHIATLFFEAPERAPDTSCVHTIPPIEFVVPGSGEAPRAPAEAVEPLAAKPTGARAHLDEEFRQLLQDRFDGTRLDWTEFMERTTGDTLIMVSESGTVRQFPKAEVMAALPGFVRQALPEEAELTVSVDDVAVYLHGEVAIVQYLLESRMVFNQEAVLKRWRNTEVFRRRSAEWQTVAYHETVIPGVIVPARIDPGIYDDYVGHYRLFTDWDYTVSRDGDILRMGFPDGAATELMPETGSTFVLRGSLYRVLFVRDEEGSVTHLRLREFPGVEYNAIRVEPGT